MYWNSLCSCCTCSCLLMSTKTTCCQLDELCVKLVSLNMFFCLIVMAKERKENREIKKRSLTQLPWKHCNLLPSCVHTLFAIFSRSPCLALLDSAIFTEPGVCITGAGPSVSATKHAGDCRRPSPSCQVFIGPFARDEHLPHQVGMPPLFPFFCAKLCTRTLIKPIWLSVFGSDWIWPQCIFMYYAH